MKNNKWIVAISISFGSLMATIDTSIVNVAIPYIRGNVGATIEEITWISTIYIIAMVLVMPLTGVLSSLFGQKKFYIASLILFIAGSFLCGLARSLPTLIFFRVIQGLGAGALQPTQQAILKQIFPAKEQGMAMAVFTMVIMMGPAIGPILGGWITDHYSWPWIFYINMPVGLLGIFLTWKNYTESDDILEANRVRGAELEKNMDWTGIILMVIGISTLQYCLEEGNSKDWFESNIILASSFIAIVSLSFFVIRELRFSHPIINLRLFADRTFLSGTVIAAVIFAVLMGSMFLLPLFMQELLGFNATLTGITLMPRAVSMLVMTPVVGYLYNKIHPAIIIAAGVILFIFSSYVLSEVTLQNSSQDIIFPLLISGAALSCLFVPLTTAALTHVQRTQIADATGLNSFVRQLGGSMGIALFATLLTHQSESARKSISWHFSLLRPEVAQHWGAMMEKFSSSGYAVAQNMVTEIFAKKASLQGLVLAFEKSFFLQGIAFLIVLPLLFFLRIEKRTLSINLKKKNWNQ